ncbi:MAG: heme exporter protein CcmB [Pseudoprimorskyibacter sp.]|jgi:heme exporter protein B|nr:heme exporter protein CcmB [Pseudoprimorskyibacter sp.]
MIALLRRDLAIAFRAGGGFGLSIAFFLIVTVLVPFGVGADVTLLSKIAPGILWVGALLACLLSLDRLFALDWEDGSLDLLATAPLPLEMVVSVKALAHWLTTGLPLVLVAPALGVLLNLPPSGYLWVLVSLGLGTPALSVIGAFGAALTVGLKRGGLLLSLLVLPLYVPTLIFGAEVARRGTAGQSVDTPLYLLAGVTLAVIALLPFASAAVLRVNLR